jgi:CRP/FNR family cyclic AMP-dependent transcriptional regulator
VPHLSRDRFLGADITKSSYASSPFTDSTVDRTRIPFDSGAPGAATTSSSSDAPRNSRALLLEDPDLADVIPPGERDRATRALRVSVLRLRAGLVDITALDLPTSTFALLITAGAITADVLVGDRVMNQLFIDGDVLLTGSPSPTTPSSSRELVVIDDAHAAVLDRRFMLGAAHWPTLMGAVMSRLADQQHRLAVHGAICQLPHSEQRTMAILCHLASRTGTVTPDGVLLRRPLSHQQIADLIGARRPTVSLALRSLQNHGLVRRRDDGSWLLSHYTGQPLKVESLVPASACEQDGQGHDR